MKTRSFLAALIAGLAVTSLQTVLAAKRDASNVITIVALGDSLTAGYGLSRKEAYPALVAEKMRAAGYKFDFVNAGSSGDTTAGGFRRLPEILRAHKKIDILILELGINDAFRGAPIEQIRSNLQAIIDQVRGHYPDISDPHRRHAAAGLFKRRLCRRFWRNLRSARGKKSRELDPLSPRRGWRKPRFEPVGPRPSQRSRAAYRRGKRLADPRTDAARKAGANPLNRCRVSLGGRFGLRRDDPLFVSRT